MRLTSESGRSVVLPETLSDSAIDGILMVVHHGATTCKREWVRDVMEREDAVRGQKSKIAMALRSLDNSDANDIHAQAARAALAAVLKNI